MTLRVNSCILRTGGAAKEQKAHLLCSLTLGPCQGTLISGLRCLTWNLRQQRFSACQSHDRKKLHRECNGQAGSSAQLKHLDFRLWTLSKSAQGTWGAFLADTYQQGQMIRCPVLAKRYCSSPVILGDTRTIQAAFGVWKKLSILYLGSLGYFQANI